MLVYHDNYFLVFPFVDKLRFHFFDPPYFLSVIDLFSNRVACSCMFIPCMTHLAVSHHLPYLRSTSRGFILRREKCVVCSGASESDVRALLITVPTSFLTGSSNKFQYWQRLSTRLADLSWPLHLIGESSGYIILLRHIRMRRHFRARHMK